MSRRKDGSVRSVALFHNERKPEAVSAARTVRALLRKAGVRVEEAGTAGEEAVSRCELALAVGGDGTMLRASRLLAPHSIPLLGVNTGGLGFLSGTDVAGLRRNLKKLLSGGFSSSERSLLTVELRRGGRRVLGPTTALNDCIVRCSDHARAVTLEAYCSGQFVATYFGDGLAVSTPTGSTAYALAVGGPVVHPSLDALLLTPICPHTLAQRPLILPGAGTITVRLARKNSQDRPQASVSLDGQITRPLRVGDEVVVQGADPPFRILLDPERSYFENLRTKLKWGQR